MKVVTTFEQTRELGTDVGLVPTMGFFHEGHLSLMQRAVADSETTLVTLFVNPLQFNDPSDLDRYPTDHDRDLALADDVGVDVVFIPSVQEMYPVEPTTTVSPGSLADHFEGPCRPGHLDGVAIAVAKLFAGTQPDRAYFGRKDAQQLAVVTRLALDLSLPVEVVGCPLVREEDGLALSSRNVFLGDDREDALGISQGLFAAADLVEAGERDAASVCTAVIEAAGLEFEYVAIADAMTMEPLDAVGPDTVLVVAARVGTVRLIDNVSFWALEDRLIADRGTTLNGPSMLTKEVHDVSGD